MKALPRVCPHLHIPLQSGDEEILKRMNRRYGRGFYLNLIHGLRSEIPDFCLSMDVMVGFPGEEESHFQNTLSLIEETRPVRIHSFPYSHRQGTRAARLENIPRFVIRDRMDRLREFSREIATREKAKFLGQTVPVLVEQKARRSGLCQGHTVHYLKVLFQTSPRFLGKTVPVRLVEVREENILGHGEGSRIE
jgi:tRNA A37 methylthiotransferase MiaB